MEEQFGPDVRHDALHLCEVADVERPDPVMGWTAWQV
jgi:hypothetical protein